jgi:hypothetical protein
MRTCDHTQRKHSHAAQHDRRRLGHRLNRKLDVLIVPIGNCARACGTESATAVDNVFHADAVACADTSRIDDRAERIGRETAKRTNTRAVGEDRVLLIDGGRAGADGQRADTTTRRVIVPVRAGIAVRRRADRLPGLRAERRGGHGSNECAA